MRKSPDCVVGGFFCRVKILRKVCGKTAVFSGGLVVGYRHRGIPESILEVRTMEIERSDFASKGVAGAGLGLGIAGTALGLLNGGGLGSIFGGGTAACSDNMAVNRYELNMQKELTNKDMEIAYLRGRDASKSDDLALYQRFDGEIRRIDRELADQRVLNATTGAAVSCLTGQVNGMQMLLNSITKTVVPNSAICPGWGDVTVSVTPTTAG